MARASTARTRAAAATSWALTWVQLEVVTQRAWREIEKLHPDEMELCRVEIHRSLANMRDSGPAA